MQILNILFIINHHTECQTLQKSKTLFIYQLISFIFTILVLSFLSKYSKIDNKQKSVLLSTKFLIQNTYFLQLIRIIEFPWCNYPKQYQTRATNYPKGLNATLINGRTSSERHSSWTFFSLYIVYLLLHMKLPFSRPDIYLPVSYPSRFISYSVASFATELSHLNFTKWEQRLHPTGFIFERAHTRRVKVYTDAWQVRVTPTE